MTDENDNIDEIEKEKERKKGESGKGRVGGAAGSGALGAVGQSGIAFSVDAVRLKTIMADWRKLNMAEAMTAVAEFFGEGVARASANVVVSFVGTVKAGYATMNRFITFGQEVVAVTRTRSRDVTTQFMRKYGVAFKAKATNKIKPAANPTVS